MERLEAYRHALVAYIEGSTGPMPRNLAVARSRPQRQSRARNQGSNSVDDPGFGLWSVNEIFGCDPTSLVQRPQLVNVGVDAAAQTHISASQQDVVRALEASPDGNCFFK